MSDLNFALEEYKVLHAELDRHVQETLALERYAAAGVAAVFAWLSTPANNAVMLPRWVWFVPILLPVVGGLRCLALYQHIGLIAEYLNQLETELGTNRRPGMGWEKFLAQRRRPTRGAIAWLIWLILLGSSEAFALLRSQPACWVTTGIVGATMVLGVVAIVLIRSRPPEAVPPKELL
jgi:hypothetical protein